MMLLAALALATAAGGPTPSPTGAFVGLTEFDRFAAAVHARCPGAKVERLHPAGLLDLEEGFREALPIAQRRRLDAAVPLSRDGGVISCAGKDGASCDAATYLRGYQSSGLLQRFARYVCRPGVLTPDHLLEP